MDFLLTPPKTTHAQEPGCQFRPPPLDGSLTVPQIYDFHYERNPNHPVFVYPDGLGGKTTLTFSEVVPAAHQAARYIANLVDIDLNSDPATFPVVAIIAMSDTITLFTTALGALRGGITIFPISPRNSVLGVADLLSRMKVSHVLVGVEQLVRELAQGAVEELIKHQQPPELYPMPSYEDLYIRSTPFVPLSPRIYDYSAPIIIVHSSGSSSFPKPIIWNSRLLLQAVLSPWFSAYDLTGKVISSTSIAMFHAIGLMFIPWLAGSGFVMATFAPASPATVPTSDAVFQGIADLRPTYSFVVPSFIEAWSQEPSKVAVLRNLTGLFYAGAPLNKIIGDQLTDEGVKLFTLYGLSECGLVGRFIPEYQGKEWEYIQLNPHCSVELLPYEEGSYEAIIVDTATQEVALSNSTFKGRPAYETNDILSPHPERAGLFKIVGRKDDQIMLSSGEKTNPGPLEDILCNSPKVSGAIMFGRGRFQNGVLVEPAGEYAFDPRDTEKLAEYRNLIWPTVEELNAYAPSHSRLFKEMILVSSPSKPFQYTPKGSVMRALILRQYHEEIEELYVSVEETTQQGLGAPADWTINNALPFVRAAVNNVLKHDITDTQNIFEGGCDSLQATWIRNSILQALRTSPGVSIAGVPSNFVYSHPSIITLVEYACAVAKPGSHSTTALSEGEDLEEVLRRYTTVFPTHVPSLPAPDIDVVLITGTTGSLGSAVLAEIVASESVGHVYAYNRRHQQQGILERQREALRLRGYNEDLVTSPKVTFVEGDLTALGLGLENSDLERKISGTVTHIIHTAWRLNFNLPLSTFETSMGGVRGLVDFALASPLPTPPRLVFTSSIGVLRNISPERPVAEAPIDDPSIPAGQGYGESKWVAEQILYAAERSTTFRPVVIRVGQISGSVNGAWNTSDWVPSIIKSSVTLGCFPEIKGLCSWISLQHAAKTLVDVRNAQSSTIHLVHPRPVPWNVLSQIFSRELNIPLVPFAEWVARVEEAGSKSNMTSGPSLETVPASMLLDLFKGALKVEASDDSEMGEVMGFPRLSIDQGLGASDTLRNTGALERLGDEDVRRWLGYWRTIGFLD